MNVFLPVSDLIDKIKEFFPVELRDEYIAFVREMERENVGFHNRIIAAQICLDGSADRWPLEKPDLSWVKDPEQRKAMEEQWKGFKDFKREGLKGAAKRS